KQVPGAIRTALVDRQDLVRRIGSDGNTGRYDTAILLRQSADSEHAAVRRQPGLFPRRAQLQIRFQSAARARGRPAWLRGWTECGRGGEFLAVDQHRRSGDVRSA